MRARVLPLAGLLFQAAVLAFPLAAGWLISTLGYPALFAVLVSFAAAQAITPTGRAHQSAKNDSYVEPFEAWITSEFGANRLYGMPSSSERVRIGRKPG